MKTDNDEYFDRIFEQMSYVQEVGGVKEVVNICIAHCRILAIVVAKQLPPEAYIQFVSRLMQSMLAEHPNVKCKIESINVTPGAKRAHRTPRAPAA